MQNRQPYPPQPLSKASQMELERIEEVLRLLDNLFQREDAVAKSIIDCLYDVGSVRLIDQKVPIKILRWPLKSIAHYSRPIFRIFALRWLRKNCPWLITRWLFNQVTFNGAPLPIEANPAAVIDVAPVQDALPPRMEPLLERQAAEINALRGRVGWLTAAVVVLMALGCLNMLR
jgi:hypothetical protein